MTFNKSNVIVSGSRSSLNEYANYTTVFPKPVTVGDKIVLTQDMINKQNVKYIIKWNFDLDDETITVPEGCLIEFDGGSFSNGTLVGNETILVYNQEEEDVFKNVSLEGSFERSTSAIADKMDNTNGMAKIYLIKNKPLATQLTQPNTIYVIQYDFTLGEDITIPANCVLEFDGGSLSNGTVHGNNCELIGDIKIPLSLNSDGNFKNRIWSFEHFGVPESPNRTENNNASDYIRHIIAFVPEGSVIKVGAKNYFVDKTIIVDKSISFESTGNHNYVTTNFYNFESSPITFFKIQAHCVSFKGIGFVGADTDDQHTSYPHTCIEIGDGLYPWDLITLIDCSIFRFNIGCIIKTNNVIIKGTGFSMSLYGVVFDGFTDSTYNSYKRNIQLLDGRFHDVKICTKFNSSWSAVMIKGFDVNHCCCLANNVNGNAIIIQGNIIYNPIEFEYNGDLYNYIINVVLGCNLSVTGNSVHIAGSDRLGFIKGNGVIIGNVIQYTRLPIYIESTSVISNNYLFKCGSKYDNVDYPVIEIVNSEYTIVMSNVLQNVSGEQNVLPSGIRMRGLSCVCRDNAVLNYTSPIEGKNSAGTSDLNYMKRLLNTQLNKGFDDLHYIPTMPADGVGDGAMAINSVGLPIFAYKNTWITADGRNNTAKRDGNTSNRPTGDKIYIGFMYFDDSLSPARPIYAAAINGTTVTWVDATGTPV